MPLCFMHYCEVVNMFYLWSQFAPVGVLVVSQYGAGQGICHVNPDLVLHSCGYKWAKSVIQSDMVGKEGRKSFVFLPVRGWSSTRLQPLLLSSTLYLVTARSASRWPRTLVTPWPVSFTLKRGLRAIWNKGKKVKAKLSE